MSATATNATSVYDFTAIKQDGSEQPLSDFKGQVLLIVNTATGCGFTPQYEDLEAIYKDFHAQGFEILDFPCNQFKEQAPGSDEEIHAFCQLHYNTEFPQFKKIDVNGAEAHPLFNYLGAQKPYNGFGRGLKAKAVQAVAALNNKKFGDAVNIGWNFTKFLVDANGQVIERFEPTQSMDEVKRAVASALEAAGHSC